MEQVAHRFGDGPGHDTHLGLKVQKLEDAQQEQEQVGCAAAHVERLEHGDVVELLKRLGHVLHGARVVLEALPAKNHNARKSVLGSCKKPAL